MDSVPAVFHFEQRKMFRKKKYRGSTKGECSSQTLKKQKNLSPDFDKCSVRITVHKCRNGGKCLTGFSSLAN